MTTVTPIQLARKFAEVVFHCLDENQKCAVLAHPAKSPVCVTHDFIDPNQAMIDAFQWLSDSELNPQEDMALVNEAWDLARKNNWFQPPAIKSNLLKSELESKPSNNVLVRTGRVGGVLIGRYLHGFGVWQVSGITGDPMVIEWYQIPAENSGYRVTDEPFRWM